MKDYDDDDDEYEHLCAILDMENTNAYFPNDKSQLIMNEIPTERKSMDKKKKKNNSS